MEGKTLKNAEHGRADETEKWQAGAGYGMADDRMADDRIAGLRDVFG